MKMTPAFIVASLVCAAPFALAVHKDLTRKDRPAFDDDDWDSDRSPRDRDYDFDRDDEEEAVVPDYEETYKSKRVEGSDLAELFGSEPASLGPVLADLKIGASSLNFQTEALRERVEAFKADHDVEVEYDFDEISLNAIDVTVEGDEEELRSAMVDRWGTPRRGGEDELVWLGPGETRAVYSSRYDGFQLRLEKYATIEQIIAPSDKAKLGFEPFPIVGGSYAKLASAFGDKLQLSSDYEGVATIALPGIGAGAGKTMIRVEANESGSKIETMSIEGATYDTDAVREALIQKWGKAESDGVELQWRKNGVTITAEFFDGGFALVERK